MLQMKFTYWQDIDFFIGYLNDFPDYETQGQTLAELQENLKEIYNDIETGEVPYIRHIAELRIS